MYNNKVKNLEGNNKGVSKFFVKYNEVEEK